MKAIIFDLDDTLYPENEFVLSGFKSITIPGFFEQAKKHFENGVLGKIFNTSLDSLGIRYNEDTIQELIKTYRSHLPTIKLFDDAKWALSNLDGYKIGIITDGYAKTQRNKVQSLGLNVDYIVYTDDYGRENWKPSPLPYNIMSEKLNVLPCECVYVADNITKDFITPNKLGWRTIQIIRPNGVYGKVVRDKEYQAQIKIKSLYDLINHI